MCACGLVGLRRQRQLQPQSQNSRETCCLLTNSVYLPRFAAVLVVTCKHSISVSCVCKKGRVLVFYPYETRCLFLFIVWFIYFLVSPPSLPDCDCVCFFAHCWEVILEYSVAQGHNCDSNIPRTATVFVHFSECVCVCAYIFHTLGKANLLS